jgi:hypothetical protein
MMIGHCAEDCISATRLWLQIQRLGVVLSSARCVCCCLQAVALLLPRFVRHMPAPVRAMVLPGAAGSNINT